MPTYIYRNIVHDLLLSSRLLRSSPLFESINQRCVSGIRRRDFEFVGAFLPYYSGLALETNVVYSSILLAYGLALLVSFVRTRYDEIARITYEKQRQTVDTREGGQAEWVFCDVCLSLEQRDV